MDTYMHIVNTNRTKTHGDDVSVSIHGKIPMIFNIWWSVHYQNLKYDVVYNFIFIQYDNGILIFVVILFCGLIFHEIISVIPFN